jgi:hypothetical protein
VPPGPRSINNRIQDTDGLCLRGDYQEMLILH